MYGKHQGYVVVGGYLKVAAYFETDELSEAYVEMARRMKLTRNGFNQSIRIYEKNYCNFQKVHEIIVP